MVKKLELKRKEGTKGEETWQKKGLTRGAQQTMSGVHQRKTPQKSETE